MRFLIPFAIICSALPLSSQGYDLFVPDGRFSADDVIWAYDLDQGVDASLNAANGELNLFHTINSTGTPFLRTLDADDTKVYWANNNGSIFANSIADSTITTLYNTFQTGIRNISVNGDKLYWHDEESDTIYAGKIDGSGEPAALATVTAISDMVATNDSIFYTINRRHVRKVSTSGGTPEIHFTTGNAFTTLQGLDCIPG